MFAAASLYFSDRLPDGIALGGCAEVYLSVTTKRSSVFHLATRHGAKVEDGWLITLNGIGLAEPELRPSRWQKLDGDIIVDLGPAARQNILPAADLPTFLKTVLNLDGDPQSRHTILLRPFIHRRSGAVTRASPEAPGPRVARF